MIFNIYADATQLINNYTALDFVIFWFFVANMKKKSVKFFSLKLAFRLFVKAPLLNIRHRSSWRPYFKKDGYLGYLTDLSVWK